MSCSPLCHLSSAHAASGGRPSDHQNRASVYNPLMYIIAIGWLYVTVLMALTETSIIAGILTLLFYGLLPIALLLWLFGGPARRRRAAGKNLESTADVGPDQRDR